MKTPLKPSVAKMEHNESIWWQAATSWLDKAIKKNAFWNYIVPFYNPVICFIFLLILEIKICEHLYCNLRQDLSATCFCSL